MALAHFRLVCGFMSPFSEINEQVFLKWSKIFLVPAHATKCDH